MKIRTLLSALLATAVLLAPRIADARWLNPNTGRFQTMDSYEGNPTDPQSLHKYTYAHSDPVNRVDPSGAFDLSIAGLTSSMGISDILDTMKSLKDVGFEQGMKEVQRELLNDASFKDLPENQKLGLLGEAAWVAYLRTVGFTATKFNESISANGPDIAAYGQRNGRYYLIIGEVKATRKVPGLGLLRKLQNNIRQMSATWLDRYASQVVDGLVSLGLSYVPKEILPAINRGEIDLYLLAATQQITGSNWELRGFRLLHVGGDDVMLPGGGLPEIVNPKTFCSP
jgi:hypothetical protein